MSRSGRIPISVPENTEIKIENNVIFAIVDDSGPNP